MRGPSSSHTAGAHRIGLMVRDLLGDEPEEVLVTFDPEGSMAPTWRPLGVDLAFTAGVMGWSMLERDYLSSVDRAREAGVAVRFEIAPLEDTEHPNGMLIDATSGNGRRIQVVAEAVGDLGDHLWTLDRGSVHPHLVRPGAQQPVQRRVLARRQLDRAISDGERRGPWRIGQVSDPEFGRGRVAGATKSSKKARSADAPRAKPFLR